MSDDVLLFCYEPAVVCAFFRLCWILFLDLANLKGHFCFFGDNMLFACSPLSSVLATTALVRDCIELLPFIAMAVLVACLRRGKTSLR